MANILRIKRRVTGSSGAPASLANAELAFNEVDQKLYYGKGDNGSGQATSIIAIGGVGWDSTPDLSGYALKDGNNTFGGTYANTFNGTVNLAGTIQINGSAVNTSAAELNVLDGVTAGSAAASKALVLNSSLVVGGGGMSLDFDTGAVTGASVTGTNLTANESLTLGGQNVQATDVVFSVYSYDLPSSYLGASMTAGGDLTVATLATTGAAEIGTNLTVQGNLTVNGTTTTVNSTVVTVDDPIFTLGGDTAPSSDDNKDRGVAFRWHNGTAAKIGFFGYDDSAGAFTIVPDATITSEVISGTAGAVVFGDATLTTVNKVTITAPASGSTLTIANGKTLTASNTLTFTGTDSSSVAFGAGGTVAYTGNTLAVFSATTSAQLAGVISDDTGSGALVFANTPTLVTPVLGTPTSGTLTNCTGYTVGNLSGLGAGVATFLATPSSANLANAVTDETGSGALVFANTPTLVTPVLGVATATSVNKVAITAPATSATLTIADSKTLTVSNTLTFTGTDTASVAFGAGGTVAYQGTGNTFTGNNAFHFTTGTTFRPAATQDGIIILGRAGGTSSYDVTLATATLSADRTLTLPDATGTVALTGDKLSAFAATTSAELAGVISDDTGSGALVFANTPTLVTPVLGTPTSGTLTNCTGLPVSTGISGLGTGVATFLATPSSANLASAVTDETGSGALVFGTNPAFTTSVTTDSTTFAVFNTTATTVNAFGAATALSLGAGSGTTTINNNLTVTGNLTINGTTTTVNSTVTTIDDPIITLGGDTAPSSDDNKDRGVEFRWHNGTTAKVGFFGFDDSTGKLTFIPDATNTSEVFSGTRGTIDVGAVHINGSPIAASHLSDGTTGSGSIVLANNPTLVTPALGTPTSGTLTNCTGLPVSTGISGFGTGVATFLATPSSANLLAAITDETGSGALVFANTPTLVTPVLGTPTSGTLTNCTGLPISTGVSGLGTGVATFLATPSSANLAAALTNETGTSFVVFSDSPTLTGTPLAPTAAVDTNTTQIATTAFVIGQGYLKTANVCSAIANCTLDGGTF